MTPLETVRKEMDALPPVLRSLLDAELAAGNSVIEIGHSFPAPPVGAYFKLAQPLLSRARASGEGVDYYKRNSSLYSGEITDGKRFFFLLEPAEPPPPELTMEEIRALHTPVNQVPEGESRHIEAIQEMIRRLSSGDIISNDKKSDRSSLVRRFQNSMAIDYEKWHDGIGYDLTLIKSATPEEREEIEGIILARDARDWRDVEALAAVDSPRARKALQSALKSARPEIRVAVMDHAPGLVSKAARVRTLVEALRSAEFYGGLTEALGQAERFHPPAVVAELFRGALEREGGVGVHFAAMLMFIHGKAASAFDWSQRPFFLRFNATVLDEREAVFLELCEKIGAPAEPFARKVRTRQQKRMRHEQKKARLAHSLVPVFEVEIDREHSTLTYRETKRSATVTCTFTGAPRLSVRSLSDWLYTASPRRKRMTEEEKAETLARIMDYCRNRYGILDLQRDE